MGVIWTEGDKRNEGTPARALFPCESGGRIPRREYTRDVPKHYDGGDIDAENRWYGDRMCCLTCRETVAMRMTMTASYGVVALVCGECGEVFAEQRKF